MRDGVIRGLGLTPEEAKRATEMVVVVREDTRTGLPFMAGTVRPLLETHRPDLLWIDPALAYLGGEVGSQKDVGGFLRNMLNPLIREFNCAVIVVHHTNKPPTGKEKPDWSGADYAYLGGGSAEWANWARAVLVVRSLGSQTVYELRAGKRGGRLGWRADDGETKAYAKLIAHAKEPGVICWREAEESEVPQSPKTKRVCGSCAACKDQLRVAGELVELLPPRARRRLLRRRMGLNCGGVLQRHSVPGLWRASGVEVQRGGPLWRRGLGRTRRPKSFPLICPGGGEVACPPTLEARACALRRDGAREADGPPTLRRDGKGAGRPTAGLVWAA